MRTMMMVTEMAALPVCAAYEARQESEMATHANDSRASAFRLRLK